MTTQPQPPVTVTPSLPNRRNAELFLLGFASVAFGFAHDDYQGGDVAGKMAAGTDGSGA